MLENEMRISLTLVAFDKMSRVIKDAVQKSSQEFQKLQNEVSKTSMQFEELGKKMMMLGGGVTALGVGFAHKLGMTEAVQEAFQLEHQLRELGNVGQLTNGQLSDMDKRLGELSKNTNQYRSEIAEGLNVLVASGIAPEKALDYMNVIGKTATAAGAEISDISKTAFSLTDNLKVPVSELNRTMDILAQAGKEGRFELKDMAAAFPSLTAGASMLGMKGVPAVTELGAALQIAMKGAGSASEAANNLENFIQKVTSPLAVKNFQENFGIDLKQVLTEASAQKKDVILEVLEVMKEASGGDIFKVSEVFQDKQVLAFIKPMLQNLEEYKRIKQSALSAEGIVDSDFNHMMETTIEQWKQLRINMKELVFPHLHAPLKAINNILNVINSNPLLQKGLFTAIIGTIGAGIVLTTIGMATFLIGKFTAGYGALLTQARLLTPVLMKNCVAFLEFAGLRSSAHSIETAFNIFKSGNKLGLNLFHHSLLGVGADIRRIDNNLKVAFKSLPSNIWKSVVALKTWAVTSIKAFPTNLANGLIAFKKGFLGIPAMIRNAIVAFRAFSLTLLTSPIGWIALAVAGVAFLIYKYWKPITGFFRGVWQGLKAGLQPLMPIFKKIAVALNLILMPIKALFNWIKKLFTPVEDVGGAAEKMGVKFGKAIADIILKFANLVKKVFDIGAKIGDMLSFGLLSKTKNTQKAIEAHAKIIDDHLPHSPAKVGPLKNLNKIRIAETIAQTIKPFPIISAMNKALTFKAPVIKGNVRGANTSNSSTVINYNPTITISGTTSKEDFTVILKKHKDEILNIVRRENERQMRLAY